MLHELSQNLLDLNSGHTLPILLQRMLAQKTRELAALTEINRGIAAGAGRDALLQKIADEAKALLGLDGVVIRVLENGKLARAAHAGGGRRARASVELDAEESLSGIAARENRLLAAADVARAAALTPRYQDFLSERACRAALCLPLSAADRVLGAIVGSSERAREFQPEEVEVMAALAAQAAIVLEKSALLNDAGKNSAELKKVNEEFEQARHAKAKFISAVSHELRTPLQVIIGYADLLREGIVGESREEQDRVLSTILQNAELLDRLIGNVLALTKAEVKQTVLDISTVEIGEVLERIEHFARRIDPNRRLKFSFASESVPPLTTDATKLQAILQNLIGNAWKFTLEGGIAVRVKNLPDRSRVEISVADTGIGIGENEREKIFDEFYQGEQARATNRSGVGLGLSIVKKYLALMQGEIRVNGAPGQGTTFTFTLPYSIT